jgi:hypothetical protein
MKPLLFIISLLLFNLEVHANPPRFSKDLRTLTAWMQGEYDNSAQAKRDTSIKLAKAHVVRIWENLYTEAIWLYEEITDGNNVVISQRIYRFTDGQKDIFEATIYELKGIERYAGEYKQARPFDELDPESDLTGLLECTAYFRKKGDKKYSGVTFGKECGYGKGRAKYVISNFDVYEDKLVRADRGIGWDEEVVWGPQKESKGYEFKRPVMKPEKAKQQPNTQQKQPAKSGSKK